MTTQNPITINTPDNPLHQEWNEREWIGVGKKYPVSGKVPAFIEAAHSKVLVVAPIYSSYIPNQKFWSQSKQILHFLRPDWPVQTNLAFWGARWAIQANCGFFNTCLIQSEHFWGNF